MRRVASAVIVVLWCLTGAAAAGEPVKIRIGYGEVPGSITPLVFQKKEVLRHSGRSYVADPIYFRGTSAQLEAFASKQLEMGYMAFGSLASAILNAKLDLKVVSDLGQWGAHGYQSPAYVVREDAGIRTPAGLKGKVLATNVLGSGVHYAMVAMLKKHGLREKSDYTVVEVRFPAMEATLREKKVDLITALPPFYFEMHARGGVRDLFVPEDAMGPIQSLVNVVRTDFLKANREAVVDFFEDYLRALRWFLTPANRPEAVQITAAFLKRPAAVYEGWAFTKRDFYRDPDALPDVDALQRNLDTLLDLGVVPRRLEVKDHVDLAPVREAAKRLP
jgi:NitT/TauT family transport system substrate-binding protein